MDYIWYNNITMIFQVIQMFSMALVAFIALPLILALAYAKNDRLKKTLDSRPREIVFLGIALVTQLIWWAGIMIILITGG